MVKYRFHSTFSGGDIPRSDQRLRVYFVAQITALTHLLFLRVFLPLTTPRITALPPSPPLFPFASRLGRYPAQGPIQHQMSDTFLTIGHHLLPTYLEKPSIHRIRRGTSDPRRIPYFYLTHAEPERDRRSLWILSFSRSLHLFLPTMPASPLAYQLTFKLSLLATPELFFSVSCPRWSKSREPFCSNWTAAWKTRILEVIVCV
ncbi:hypothetical protein EV421DRAFT_1857149, partial [Armillaria borealis]